MFSVAQNFTNDTLHLPLPQLEARVKHLFDLHQMPDLPFHNLAHTRDVVQAAQQLATHYQLNETQSWIVIAAAWFQDAGYPVAPSENHAEGYEEKSIELATTFLREQKVHPSIISQVQSCIRAAKLPQSPQNLLEEIVCDAALFYLGTDTYQEKSKRLRQEKQLLCGQEISGSEWRKHNIAFLQSHQYFTGYAQSLLQEGKARNLLWLQEKQAKKKKDEHRKKKHKKESQTLEVQNEVSGQEKQKKSAGKKKLEKKQMKLDRDVTTLFRITFSNHINLGEMADRKARIMISVNSILVSVIVSLLIRRIHENMYLIVPTLLFLTTSVLTIIFSVLATRPTAGSGVFSKEDIEQKKGDLLFFGNFYKMKLEEYKAGINQLISDRDFLYGSMTEDIFRMGVMLGRKYKLLRIAYNIFMVGFVLAVTAYSMVIIFEI